MSNNIEKRKRLELPDNLRGLALISLILIHVLNLYGSHSLDDGGFYGFLQFLAGPPCAPVYMAVMGFFFFMKRPTMAAAFKRGVLLVLLGYSLNFLKGFLPVFLAREVFGWDDSLFPSLYSSSYYLIFEVEILIMAGLSFIAMGWVTSFTKNPKHILLMALTVMLISPFLWGRGENIPFLRHILIPLWGGDTELVVFPLFPWFSYSLLGLAMGAIFQNDKDEKSLIKKSLLSGAALLLLGGILLIIDFDFFFNDYGQQTWGAVTAFSGFILIWGNLIYLIQKVYPEKMKTGFLRYFSIKLTFIYCIQWIFIGWLFFLIPFHSLTMGFVFVIALGVVLITWASSRIKDWVNIQGNNN